MAFFKALSHPWAVQHQRLGKTNDVPSDFARPLIRIKKGRQRPIIEAGDLKPRCAFLDCSRPGTSFFA